MVMFILAIHKPHIREHCRPSKVNHEIAMVKTTETRNTCRESIGICRKALTIVRKRGSVHPEHEVYPWLISEIDYVKSVLTGSSIDRSRLHKINLGGGEARSGMLQEQDSELYEALANVSYIAAQIDLQVLSARPSLGV